MIDLTNSHTCQTEDVAAYLDGELSSSDEENFEAHLQTCARCDAELRTQRQLLCTLDVAFGKSSSFELPQDFTRVVAAHAESDVSGMRRKSERRRALQLCAVLALLSFALLGAASGTLVFQPARSFLHLAGSLLDLVWRTIYDAGTGLAVIVRVVGRGLVLAPHGLGLLLVIPLVIAIAVLPRLIANYHRAQIVE